MIKYVRTAGDDVIKFWVVAPYCCNHVSPNVVSIELVLIQYQNLIPHSLHTLTNCILEFFFLPRLDGFEVPLHLGHFTLL